MSERTFTPPVNPDTEVVHGKPYTYRRYNCSCGPCKKAWREHMQAYRLRSGITKVARTGPPMVAAHGTVTKYATCTDGPHGLPCDDCTEANRQRR